MVDAKVPDTRRMAAEAPVELGENNSSFFFPNERCHNRCVIDDRSRASEENCCYHSHFTISELENVSIATLCCWRPCGECFFPTVGVCLPGCVDPRGGKAVGHSEGTFYKL